MNEEIQVSGIVVVNETGKRVSKQSMKYIEETIAEFELNEYLTWKLVNVSDAPRYERLYLITNTMFLLQDYP